ncbi:hypothetical protein IE992_14265 [Klebsiella pneumoniae]|uniref:Uncharacterized protein n=1 Tax=Klebsiella pneumoniae TaxID=573 RepID=A0A927HV64_KLEPN|nr:hypothetical protein [Klebsiella pneumoniae]
MPLTVRSPTLSLSAIRMSQVEVPMTFTSALGCAPAPTAPMWQSKAPPEMATLCDRPEALGPLCAQRADRHIGRPGIGEQRPVPDAG